jgi:Fe-S oxidoreductase
MTVEAVMRSGARTVVCADVDDLNALRAHTPKVADMGDRTVLHAIEMLDRLVRRRKLKPKKRLDARVAYHDPCNLGRLSEPFRYWRGEMKKIMQHLVIYDPPRSVNRGTYGCYEPPRRLLKKIPGLELVEFHRRREYSFCCGGGGAVYEAGHTDFIKSTALHRMEEAKDVGADMVVTACPNCEHTLGQAADRVGITVRSVIDLLIESVKG